MTAELGTSTIVGSAFRAALLLTGNMLSAERVVLSAIESSSPGSCNAEACLLKTIEESVRCCGKSGEQTEAAIAEDWPGLPAELRRVTQMQASLRHCFVIRVLLGFPEEHSARLLKIHPRQVRMRTSEAMQWLAALPEALEPARALTEVPLKKARTPPSCVVGDTRPLVTAAPG